MCNLCCDLDTAKERMKKYKSNGVSLGKTDKVNIWEGEQAIEATLWFDKEGTMKQRTVFIELSNTIDDKGKGVRLIYPVKVCPKCGRELVIK
jgi:hypothetical protein